MEEKPTGRLCGRDWLGGHTAFRTFCKFFEAKGGV